MHHSSTYLLSKLAFCAFSTVNYTRIADFAAILCTFRIESMLEIKTGCDFHMNAFKIISTLQNLQKPTT